MTTSTRSDSSSSSSWSIGVKTVGSGSSGAGIHRLNDDDSNSNSQHMDDFTVTVHPDDDLMCLHHQIEGITGLKTSQQRLIYRGRLISGGGESSHRSSNENDDDNEKETASNDQPREPKVRDVVGLCDGQTIHLVPKRAVDEQQGTNSTSSTSEQNGDNNGNSSSSSSSSDSIGRSLLATLLGLGSGSLDDDQDQDGDENDEDDEASMSSPSLRRLRSSRRNSTTSSRRSTSHRLTESDLVVPDPGTMEPVRQGLMTLHTMLEVAQTTQEPWEACRQWYRGQWVDCRDTVNQWLEATIVDIAHPDDILPQRTLDTRRRRHGEAARSTTATTTRQQPATDAVVTAHDYEGRRNLLLEPDGQGGHRERPNNHGVHLLLIHYNGWPHRWDEWIRSDSERLRPFRTRTRHNPSSGTSLPAPQSLLEGAPSTNIKNDDDDEGGDRVALLPELSRAVSSVNDMLEQVVSASRGASLAQQRSSDVATNNRPRHTDLPWLPADANDASSPSTWSSSPETNSNQPRYSRRQLQALAPLLDRLGRALTDAAPHVASLASTLPEDDDEAFPNESNTDPENNVIIVGESSEEQEDAAPSASEERRSMSGSGFFSLLSRDNRARTSAAARDNGSSRISARLDETIHEEEEAVPPPAPRDPDYVDFVNGMVNTTRGDIRSGPSRRSGSDDAASLLGAYLALSSLASNSEGESNNGNDGGGGNGGGGVLSRLLRDRGNATTNDGNGGGPGIDIHIHAIVTGPGVGPGGLGMAMMAGAAPPFTNTGNETANGTTRGGLFANRRGAGGAGTESSRQASTSAAGDDDDMGIFADLYSENPSPLDPHETAGTTDDANDGYGGSTFASMANRHLDEGGESERVSAASQSAPLGSLESPNRQRSMSSSPMRRSSPRRRSSIGRVFRSVLGQSSRRRNSSSNNAQDSDSESQQYTDE